MGTRASLFLLPWRIATAFVDDPRRIARAVRGLPPFLRDLRMYRARQGGIPSSLSIRLRDLYPRLGDRFEQAAAVPVHYFHQDLWAARRIREAAPVEHIDIGSRIDGFVGHLLAFRDVTVMDLRPLDRIDPALHFVRADITSLPQEDRSLASVSSLHVIEHVGLGRYGDLIDPNGCFTAMRELQRVLAPGGRLYFSVPVGRERVEFNAHRVFAPRTILETFDELTLTEFSAVADDGLVEHVDPDMFERAQYACGLFIFERI